MSKFVLTAQLKLQAPTNTQQVVRQMQAQLKGISVPVQVTGATKATKQIKQVTAATNQATSAAHNMGKSFGLALKRFAAFTVASRAVSLFTNTMANATSEAIDFQREIVKISQVTGKSVASLKGLNQEITRLATSLGTSSKELLGATRILAQAGIQANDLKVALDALAKTTLAPTFEDINKTAEGAVAILAQFGQGVGKLKDQLGAINAVAGQFAVESGDLIGAIRRTGGVFKAAGGNLNEFLGLFTSIRATTRESAESIATGLRTILTRIQRPATIQYLKDLGVSLTDLNGKFVGPFEAVKRLSKALADVPAGDLKFIQIAEELGGFRQIGKVIPLLQEFETAERARQAAIAGASSLDKDAATAQQALAVQIQKTKEEFLALIRSISETTAFQAMVKTALNLANALISVADALKPLLPLLAGLAAFKFAGAIGGFGRGIGSAIKGVQGKAQGGKIMAFARGGVVPGTGSRDTVPAMLQPGEFVIRKSSVKKLGTNNLSKMNAKGYASGGAVVQLQDDRLAGFFLRPSEGDDRSGVAKEKTAFGHISNPKAIAKLRGMANVAQPQLAQTKEATLGSMTGAKQQEALITAGGPNYANVINMSDKSPIIKGGKISTKLRDNLAKQNKVGKQQAESEIKKAIDDSTLEKSDIAESIRIGINGRLQGLILGDGDSKVTSTVNKAVKEASSDGLRKAIDDSFASEAVQAITKKSNKIYVDKEKAKTSLEDNLLSLKSDAVATVSGYVNEGLTSKVTGAPLAGGGARLDFPHIDKNARNRLELLYGEISKNVRAADGKPEAKGTEYTAIAKKFVGEMDGENYDRFIDKRFIKSAKPAPGAKKFASGGAASDTVPALLTPGEFVLNKKAAASIGASNLNRMNKKGVQGFAKGGAVQRLNAGGGVGGMMGGLGNSLMIFSAAIAGLNGIISQFGDKSLEASDAQANITIAAERAVSAFTAMVAIAIATVIALQKIDKWGKKSGDELEGLADGASGAKQSAEEQGASGGGGELSDDDAAGAMAGAASQQNLTIPAELDARKQEQGQAKKEQEKKAEAAYADDMATYVHASQQESTQVADAKKEAAITEGMQADHADKVQATKDTKLAREDAEIMEQGAKVVETSATKKTKADEANVESLKEARPELQAEEARATRELSGAAGRQVELEKESKASGELEAEARGKAARSEANVQDAEKLHTARTKSASETQKGIDTEKAELESRIQKELKTQTAPASADVGRAVKAGDAEAQAEASAATEESSQKIGVLRDRLAELDAKSTRAAEAVLESEMALEEAKSAHSANAAEVAETSAMNKKATSEAERHALGLQGLRDAQSDAAKAVKDNNSEIVDGVSEYNASLAAQEAATRDLAKASQEVEDAMANEYSARQEAHKATRDTNEQIDKHNKVHKEARQAIQNRENAEESLNKHDIKAIKTAREANKTTKQGIKVDKQDVTEEKKKQGLVKRSLSWMKTKLRLNKKEEQQGKKNINTSKKKLRLDKNEEKLTKKQAEAIKKVTAQRKKENQASKGGGGVRRGAATVGKAAAIGGGLLAGASQALSAITGAIGEMANRQKEIAIGAGDVGGAASAGREAAKMEGIGQIFSMSGMIAMAFGSGSDLIKSIKQNIANAGVEAAAQAAQVKTTGLFESVEDGGDMKDIGKQLGAVSRDVLREMEVGDADEKTKQQATKQLKDNEKRFAEGIGKSARTMAEVEAQIASLGDSTAYSKEQLLRMGKQAFAVEEALRATARAMFDNLKVMSAFNRANLAVDQFLNSLKTGSSTLADSIATVEAAATNMGMGAEGNAALDEIRQRVIAAAAGGDETTAQGQAINRQFSRAQSANEFMGSIQGRISSLDLSSGDEAAAKAQLESALLAGVKDADIRAAITAKIAGMGDIRNKDLSGIVAEITGSLGPLRDGAMQAAKALLQHEQTIAKLTDQRRKAELAYIAAQRQAIDAQLQFAKTFEEFGGSKLTSDQKLSANLAKFNLGARDAGIQELRTGSVADIQAVAASIQNNMNQQQIDRAAGGFRDVQGIDADRIKETNSSIKDLVGFIKSQIAATKEQIAIIEKRNKIEQDSISSLLQGDFAGFLKGQETAGAASALRSGDEELASLFGPAALGNALKQLQAEGADQATLQKAGQIAAQSVGLDGRAGQVLSGTTDELNDLRAQGRALSEAGGQVSQMMADSAMMEIAQAELAIEQANVVFKNTMDKAGRRQERADAGLPLSRGGVVYANRGIFVPRGTDTVPAMLTPGEFVVNRAAVQRGNNLQILRAMNASGQTLNAGAQGAANLSSGGSVGYYNMGDLVKSLGSVFGKALPNMERIFNNFSKGLEQLANMEVGVAILKPIDVNIRLLNDNILRVIEDNIRDAVIDEVAREIPKYKSRGSGIKRKRRGLVDN